MLVACHGARVLLTYLIMHPAGGYVLSVFATFAAVAPAHALTLEQTVSFVRRSMPTQDKTRVTPAQIESHARQALSMRGRFAWSENLPDSLFLNDVAPYAILGEARGDWRTPLAALYAPAVANCRTAREAVWRIVSHMSRDTGVAYSRERRRAVMSPLEALSEKKVSCTGQSILVACALRSVGIPARVAGIASWNHIRGNHTWAEAWYEGEWHMIEFNEKAENTPWVMEGIGMLDPRQPSQRIIASSWQPGPGTATFPPIERQKGHEPVPGVDVTPRYMQLARAWYENSGLPDGSLRLFIESTGGALQRRIPLHIVLLGPDGSIADEGDSPGEEDDMRYYLRLTAPCRSGYTLQARGTKNGPVLATASVEPGDAPSQVIRLSIPDRQP